MASSLTSRGSGIEAIITLVATSINRPANTPNNYFIYFIFCIHTLYYNLIIINKKTIYHNVFRASYIAY
ncbi:MAG TPA: hypothetical protein PLV35_02280, partial [Candidatus Paceibacterota bacterium]|nr:hypothetical protein [Candidatus Paceibacterota bacterium]